MGARSTSTADSACDARASRGAQVVTLVLAACVPDAPPARPPVASAPALDAAAGNASARDAAADAAPAPVALASDAGAGPESSSAADASPWVDGPHLLPFGKNRTI